MKKFLNNKKSSIFGKIIVLILLLFLYTFISALNYVQAISSDISSSVFRLHVIANSNKEAMSTVSCHKDEFRQVALNTIRNEGYSYDVKIQIGNFEFPTKHYGDISLPAGFYDALKVEIGEAQGRNWWCVMFPSLCFVDVSNGFVPEESKDELKNALTDEEYSLISDNSNSEIKFKFKLIEFFTNNSLLTAKNQ